MSKAAAVEHSVPLTNPDKLLWPRDGYAKRDLVNYYRAVARWMLPHLRDRPLTLQRYPDGVDGESFFSKNAPKGLPAWIPTVRIPAEFGHNALTAFIVCNDEAALAYLGNLAAIILHIWTSRSASLDVPDFVLFDLDAGEGCTLATMALVALAVREALKAIRAGALVKTTGGSGLHVVVPLRSGATYRQAKDFAEVIARAVHRDLGGKTTLERVVARRPHGTVYLDYVQVGEGKTMVAPYSPRARDGAPVSMPLDWSVVEGMARKRSPETEREQLRWTIANVPKLLAADGDAWSRSAWKECDLAAALERAGQAFGIEPTRRGR